MLRRTLTSLVLGLWLLGASAGAQVQAEGVTFTWLPPLGVAVAVITVLYLVSAILRTSEGPPEMMAIAAAIRSGARAYLRRQYSTVAVFFAVVFVILLPLSLEGYVTLFAPYAFVIGGLCSALAGYIGMSIATASNARTTNAASVGLNQGLRLAFSSGAVMGLTVVGLGLGYVTAWYFFLIAFYGPGQLSQVASNMLVLGMGASAMALFARVGGGIFTKAADVGADLVGKVEAGIPEDDPRNPAVIADNVGDNVGDVAGMGADLYESYVGAIVAAAALAVAANLGVAGMVVPLAVAGLGIVCSALGTFLVSARDGADMNGLLWALRKGIFSAGGLTLVLSLPLVLLALPGHFGVYLALVIGLAAGIIIGLATEYYTNSQTRPTLSIVDASTTGPATNIIAGLAVGMQSTMVPVVTIGLGTVLAYLAAAEPANPALGIYGVGLAAVGMLSTLGITLATDAYGPVADNAGGIAQMSHQPPEVRKRTDALDALGNTTAATGKGFAIGSAALTALALIAGFQAEIARLGRPLALTLTDPGMVTGLFIGAMLPFVFSAMAMQAVGRAAGAVVVEVRRQFREIPGLLEGKSGAQADYARCVDISTRGAQREMVLPGITALVAPVLTGLVLGPEALGGLLAGSLVSGFVLAIMMANAGGAWDNAKKAIEGGRHGGKGSSSHKAAVVGDTVGDPFKDTAGPSLNILLKLMSIVAIVIAPLLVRVTPLLDLLR